jgi:N-acetyl-alpha-D-muramate 1-phosphate uridylyltransferase
MSGPMLPVAILAGGLATRLRPLTETIPKSLVEINGEPFLWHQLRLLHRNGIEHVVLCVSHLGEQVRDSVGDGCEFGLHIDYSFDGSTLLGTAGALKRALPMLGESFFVLYGDSYLPIVLPDVETAFRASGKAGLMTVYPNHGQWDTSNVEFVDGRILAYNKKLHTVRMRHIDYGLGVFQAAAFRRVPAGQPWDLAALYQDLLGAGELAAFEAPHRFYEIGSFHGIEELSLYLRQGCESA